jgi:lactoylglutathione lyase
MPEIAFRDAFPILSVEDVERSLRFYRDLLGYELTFRWPEEGAIEFAFVQLGASGLGLGKVGEVHSIVGRPVDPPPADRLPRFELCLYVDDVDAASAYLLANGVERLVPPTDQPWGERLAYFADPDGNPIHVCAQLAAG